MKVEFHNQSDIKDEWLKYAVIMSKYQGKWIYVRHEARETWEMPGGRREANEDIVQTAHRELMEETGAKEYELQVIGVYSVTQDLETSYGLLCYVEIREFGYPLCMEICQIKAFEHMPTNLTYPLIQPKLYEKVLEHLGYRPTVVHKKNLQGFYVKGQLREAMDYLSKVPELRNLYEKYVAVFEQDEKVSRTENQWLDDLDQIYQNYYKAIFYYHKPQEEAERTLFKSLWDYCGSKSALPVDESIEEEIEKRVKALGYHFIGGKTSGYYGPYIWRNSTKETYDVTLPDGNESYSIVMMDGFVSRSWMDFISFGMTGTGGWSGKDGLIYCVRQVYDVESDEFKISFLKHEAQHAVDMRSYPRMESVDLEYRAKLVELMYWPNDKQIKAILKEADESSPNNAHAMASHKIISGLSQHIFDREYVEDTTLWENHLESVREGARVLFEVSRLQKD